MSQSQEPSIRSLDILKLSIPLMLAGLSTNLMNFVDRLILARYSVEAMNAAASADWILFIFIMAGIGIAGVTEIYVGRYHGAQEFQKMGKLVWQMLWLSLMLSFVFVPCGWLLKDWLIVRELQQEGGNYFFLLMSFGGLSVANTALSAFFVGKGETKWITLSVVITSILNFLLDILLVFGWKIIPPLGATGAAIATIASQIAQFIFLASIFFNKKHRTFYGTSDYRFDKKLFKESIQLGFPGALSRSFEMAAWAYLTSFLVMHDTAYVTIQVVGQTMFGLLGFLTDGLQKGVTSLASNIIGASNPQLIYQTKRSAFKIQYILTALLSIPLLIYSDWLISLFLQDVSLDNLAKIKLTLMGVWIYFLLDGCNWILVGLISSAGHTTYTMIANISSWWIGALIPCFIVVHSFNSPAHMIWTIFLPLYTLLHLAILYYKFKTINWEKTRLLGNL